MSPEHSPSRDIRVQLAIEELQDLIKQHYPTATFEIQRGQDDPEAIHLVTTIDLHDTDAVFDLVADRVMELQIEESLPVFVVPVRPPERVRTMLETARDPQLPEMPVTSSHS